jgi:molybdopterin synthase catalytic subunit
VPVRVQHEDFDVGAEIARLRTANPKIGAVAAFIGLARDVNDGETVAMLTLEHYAGMTERALEAICAQAKARWDIFEVLVVHRVGALRPTDQIVLVIVTGAHRGPAFAACEFVMDYLKTEAPFWKKEATPAGERWVEARASDDAARERWGSSGGPSNPGSQEKPDKNSAAAAGDTARENRRDFDLRR